MCNLMKNNLIILVTVLVWLVARPLYGIDDKIDSLKTNLQYANDTVKYSLLLDLSSLTEKISFKQSLTYAETARNIAVKLGDQEKAADATNKIGNKYFRIKKFEEAKDYYLEAMNIRKIINDVDGLASSYHNLGLTFFFLAEYDQSFNYFNNSISIRLKLGDDQKIAIGYHNLADFHYRRNNPDTAIKLNYLAFEYYEKCSNLKGKMQIMWQLGNAFFAKGENNQGLESLQKGLNIGIRTVGNENELALIEQTLGKIYAAEKNSYDKALSHYHNALEYSRKDSNYNKLKTIYLELSQLTEKKNQYDAAYRYYLKYIHLKDSLFTDENRKKVEDQKAFYETSLKENELLTLNKRMEIEMLKVKKQKAFYNYLLASLAVMIAGLSIGFLNFRKNRNNNISIVNYNKRLERTNSKIKKSENKHRQINNTKNKFLTVISHDLITPFNSLLGFTELLSEEAKSDDRSLIKKYSGIIHKSSKELYTLLENMLQWSRAIRNKISYQPEYFNIAKTIENEVNINFVKADKKNIKIKTNLDESLQPFADETLISTVVKNLLEITIINSPQNGTIGINAGIENKRIVVSISDEGKPINFREQINSSYNSAGNLSTTKEELAITVVEKFIKKNNGKFITENKQKGSGNIYIFTLPSETTFLKEI